MATDVSSIIAKMQANLTKNATEVSKKFAEAKKKGEAEHQALFNQIKGDVETYNKEAEQYNKEIESHADEVGKAFISARKEYTDVVAQSKGLTSVKPSIVKALEQLRDTMDKKYAREAAAGLEKQKDEVLKAHKGDANAVKFGKELDKLISNYKA